MWVLKVKVITWPWPKVVYIQKFKLDFLRNYCADLNHILYASFQVQGNANLMTWCWSHDQDGRHAIYFKNPSKIHETWYVALGTPAHHSLFKWWTWSVLDLLYGKIKFGNLGFSRKKVKTVDFSDTIAASDLKVSMSSHLIEYMKVCEYWMSRSFLDLGSRWCTYKNSNRIFFSETTLPIWTYFFLWKLSGKRKWKSDNMMLVTWPRWPPCPYILKTL